MQIGDPIGEGFAIYKRFWRHLLPIALVTYLVVSLIALLLAAAGGALGALGSIVVSVAGVFLLQAALVEAVADVRDGRADLSLGETLGRVWPRLGTVVAAGLLAGIAITIGLILLLVPGLYLLTIWSVVVPVIVLENVGVFDSFGRSRELVRGYGWTVFGVIVVTIVIDIVAALVLSLAFAGLSGSLARYVSNVIANTIITPFVAATWTSMYFRLRELHQPAAFPAGAAYREP
ncbi:MAG TPA: hypothetical protein VFA05_11245 [Gaiellaceae bacterium]|nr:hypothetical protein [Gaiellaceae bacterium]